VIFWVLGGFMIKRLIFDFDNTLVMWKEEYKNAIKNTISYYNLDIDYLKVDEVIETYENYYDKYNKENMIDLINKKFNLNLGIDFIDKWLEELGNMAEKDDNLIDLLEYLSKKYELVILTNWFKYSQILRLKKAGIYNFFKEIYGGDEFIKPNSISYKTAMGDKKIEECIMIGDNYKIDIEGALNLGMKAIMITKKEIESKNNLVVIDNINKLKEIL
jgi:putative hydrolase of the HAD superfamily